MAAALTALGTLLAGARQPAALSTTLLVSLGVLQTARDGVIFMAAVVLMTALGQPIRMVIELAGLTRVEKPSPQRRTQPAPP